MKRLGYRYCQRPSRGSPGVARREPLQLGVDAVARAELDLPLLDAGDEPVERAHRRAAGHLALEVVDASVAGADEPRSRHHPAHGAAEVRTASRDRHEAARLLTRQRGAGLADVGGGLAGLADAGRDRDRPRHVVVLGEVADRPDVLVDDVLLLEHGPEREPDRRQGDRGGGDPARRQRATGEERAARHRLALEVAGHLRGWEWLMNRNGAVGAVRRHGTFDACLVGHWRKVARVTYFRSRLDSGL